MVDAGFSFQQCSFLTEFHYLHTFNLCFLNFLLYTDQIFTTITSIYTPVFKSTMK